MAYACQMTDDRAPAERTLSAEQRRQLAVDLCNHVWMLLGTPGRSPEADDEMIHAALIRCTGGQRRSLTIRVRA